MAKTHEQQLGETCYKEAKKCFGTGWDLMSNDIRRMAISDRVMKVLFAQCGLDSSEEKASAFDFVKRVAQHAYAMLGEGDAPYQGESFL